MWSRGYRLNMPPGTRQVSGLGEAGRVGTGVQVGGTSVLLKLQQIIAMWEVSVTKFYDSLKIENFI